MTKLHFKHPQSVALLKSLSWRIIASATTFLLTWMITGELIAGILVGSADAVIKMFLYYFHERAWYQLTEVDELPRSRQEA